MGEKRFKWVPEMEGRTARWYSRQRGTKSQLALVHQQARELTHGVRPGGWILEVAPGPGYLSVEMARLGQFRVSGLDVSRTFVEIAREHARQSGLTVDFRQGDVASMPLESGSFDLVVCQAAFKNFVQPVQALNEIYRVLKPDGRAVIEDLSREATSAEIKEEVRRMNLTAVNAMVTRLVLATMLRRRAYSVTTFTELVARSAFRHGEIRRKGVGLDVRLHKPVPTLPQFATREYNR